MADRSRWPLASRLPSPLAGAVGGQLVVEKINCAAQTEAGCGGRDTKHYLQYLMAHHSYSY